MDISVTLILLKVVEGLDQITGVTKQAAGSTLDSFPNPHRHKGNMQTPHRKDIAKKKQTL